MRTVRRQVVALNAGKQAMLADVIDAYAREKQHWLQVFARQDTRPLLKHPRQVRDQAVQDSYVSVAGLQARMWKLALVDAAETWDKYWQALFVDVRRQVAGRPDFDPVAQHYAYWLLSGYSQCFACLEGTVPTPVFQHDPARLPAVAHWVRRQIQARRGHPPTVRQARSVALDADCYTVVEAGGTQYLKIMTLAKGQRLVLPLKGQAPLRGNLRIVMQDGRIEVHVAQGLPPKAMKSAPVEAVDFGYTEVMTDTQGQVYGSGLGRIITQAVDTRHAKGKARNRLRALAARYRHTCPRKARKIRRFNLGQRQWRDRERRTQAAIATEINSAINTLVRTKQPAVLITEDLHHAFTFDRPKTWNRRLSAWVKGVLQERVEFKALAEGFRHQQVNPAYGSQTCPRCGYVDANNRHGDRFVCLHCRHEDHADRVAAMNYLGRGDDREITRYTPYRAVKSLLQQRFHRRLEATGATAPDVTVPGRTPDTVPVVPQRPARPKSQRGGASADHPTVNRRAKQNQT